jgi:predicted transcriptional regulator
MKKPVSIALRPETTAALDRVAAEEERSRSQVADRLIRDALAARAPREAAPQQQERPQ